MGKYNVNQQLYAQGKYMTAYEAVQEGLNKRVEIRILAQRGSENSPELARFQAQIKNLANLDHPNILRVLDCGAANGKLYYVTELKPRLTLQELMAKDPPPPVDERVKIAVQIASALKYMHSKGVIHRGIDDLCINYDQDLSLAYVSQFSFVKNVRTDNLTVRGIGNVFQLLTTPEGAMGQQLDARSDVFLLGVLLFRMLTGQDPFSSKAFLGLTPETAEAIQPKRLKELDPQAMDLLDATVAKACAVLPDKRYQTAQELHDALADVAKRLKLPKWADRKDAQPGSGTATATAPATDKAPAQPGSGTATANVAEVDTLDARKQPPRAGKLPAEVTSTIDARKVPSQKAMKRAGLDKTVGAGAEPETADGAAPEGAAAAPAAKGGVAELIAQLKADPLKMKMAVGILVMAGLLAVVVLLLLLR